jgi:plasmid stabilization system protein ParE
MIIKLSPFAEQDFDDTIEFYNLQAEKLATDFFEEVDFTFNRIKENPRQFPKVHKKMRKAKTNRFPFNIFLLMNCHLPLLLASFTQVGIRMS